MNTILDEIKEKADLAYKEFHKKLIPTVDENTLLGIRAPLAMAIAKKYVNTRVGDEFLSSLPHKYYDENIVHAFMLGLLKGERCHILQKVALFLPYVDNWAVCDGLCSHLKWLFKDASSLYSFVVECTKSKSVYTARFGLVCLLNYYIDDVHIDEILNACTIISTNEYYINMAVAWLVSFCLIKQYERTLPIILNKALPVWIHNKAIQKAIESYRIDKDKKSYLRSLRIK